jgi:hypothetical protein
MDYREKIRQGAAAAGVYIPRCILYGFTISQLNQWVIIALRSREKGDMSNIPPLPKNAF